MIKNSEILKKLLQDLIQGSTVRHVNHYTKQSTVSERHRKACTRPQSWLTESSGIHQISLLNKFNAK